MLGLTRPYTHHFVKKHVFQNVKAIRQILPWIARLFEISTKDVLSWWRHQMEIFSASLAICAGNSPVPGEFPAQRPVTRSFDVYLICVRINGWVSNRDAGYLRRNRGHYDVTVMHSVNRGPDYQKFVLSPQHRDICKMMLCWLHWNLKYFHLINETNPYFK